MTSSFGQARAILRVIRLFPRAHRSLNVAYWMLVIAGGGLPIATIVATTNLARVSSRFFLDPAVDATGAFGAVFPAVLIVASLFLVQQIIGPASYWVNDTLGDRLSELWRERVMSAAVSPSGVAHLENPESADRIWLAAGLDQRSLAPARLVGAVADILVWRIQGFGSALLLLAYAWWMPLVLIVTWLPLWYVIAARTQIQMTNAEHGSNELRRSSYFRTTAMSAGAAKEIQLFGLHTWVLEKFDAHYQLGSKAMWQDLGFTRWAFLPCLLAPTIASGIILLLSVRGVIAGSISIPDMTLITLSVIGAQRIGKAMAWWTRSFFGAGAVDRGMELEDVASQPQAVLEGTKTIEQAPERIVFDHVGFTYPGATRRVFDDVELVLERGRSIAIVGPNGAGKTTLVKLLARLYDPQEGEILIDDVPLRELSPDSWRRKIAVIFQDFVRYEMTLAENIGVGSIENHTDRRVLTTAAEKAGLATLLSELEYSYDTVLARGYSRSRDLSGGEWQRVALARAFAAVEGGAQILVLDEPTANLDVDAEAAFYASFLDMTEGLTTVLITHRMASVRRVDKICVLDNERIVETGSHNELISKQGLYARMFELQAHQFEGVDRIDGNQDE